MHRRLWLVLLCLLTSAPLATQPVEPRQQLIDYLNSLAKTRLDERARTIAKITTRAAAERRRAAVRARILTLVGGLPEPNQKLAVKEMGTVAADGFRLEKIAYESLPGFWVTANVYVPTGRSGPYPAVVYTPGHGPGGKTEAWSWGANFARNGIVLLAYDPIGQGERLQYFDPEKKASVIGGPTGEHGEANIGPLLIGETLARYMVNDAMHAIDYLTGRADVDRAKVGAFGCSGGGTATALLGAIDDRVAVAASACYITSFGALLTSATGVQEAEQSLPGFISNGLDFPDWIEAFAPKPYAIVSTEDDMFPFAGARQSFDEAARFYGLFDARDRVTWITGPGGHGNLTPIAPSILAFFVKHLAGRDEQPAFRPERADRPSDMIVTSTGQVATAFTGETVASHNRARAAGVTVQPPGVSGKTGMVHRLIVDQPIHRDVSEIVVPGVLRHYDTGDLVLATYPRPVQIISPSDALGGPLPEQEAQATVERFREAELKAGLGSGQRIVVKFQRE